MAYKVRIIKDNDLGSPGEIINLGGLEACYSFVDQGYGEWVGFIPKYKSKDKVRVRYLKDVDNLFKKGFIRQLPISNAEKLVLKGVVEYVVELVEEKTIVPNKNPKKSKKVVKEIKTFKKITLKDISDLNKGLWNSNPDMKKRVKKYLRELRKHESENLIYDVDNCCFRFRNSSDPPYRNRFEKLADRICEDKPPVFFSKACDNCDTKLKTEDDKIRQYQITCGVPFCKSPGCIKQRESVNFKRYMHFFKFYSYWNEPIYDNWMHTILGFERQNHRPTRKELIDKRKQIQKFLNAWSKGMHRPKENRKGVKLKGIGCRDFSIKFDKKTKSWYIHYHFAFRPIQSIKPKELVALNELGFKYGLKFTIAKGNKEDKPNKNNPRYFEGYRPSYQLAKYFAKRDAGRFEHEQNQSDWGYSDVMSLEEYYKDFHRTRRLIHFGWSKLEIVSLNKSLKKFEQPEGLLLSSSLTINEPDVCADCGCKSFNFVPYDPLDEKKPPEDVVSVKREVFLLE